MGMGRFKKLVSLLSVERFYNLALAFDATMFAGGGGIGAPHSDRGVPSQRNDSRLRYQRTLRCLRSASWMQILAMWWKALTLESVIILFIPKTGAI